MTQLHRGNVGLRAWAYIDLDAIEHNVAVLKSIAAPARVMAVVKADAYGHGAVRVAEAALSSGADLLAVALVQEGVELRTAGIRAPILVLSEQPIDQLSDLVSHGLMATAYSDVYIDALARQASQLGVTDQLVHLKVDTGMHRVGMPPSNLIDLSRRVLDHAPILGLNGVFTHFANADDVTSDATLKQMAMFDTAIDRAHEQGIRFDAIHMANSSATLLHRESHRDMVRVGIAVYGIAPSDSLEDLCADLRPALTLTSMVSHVKSVSAGEGVSYGATYRCPTDTTIVTVPLGYADGIPRRSGEMGARVLIGGRPFPIVGVVTMDQLMVDVGDTPVSLGDEVVLIGRQGSQVITANDWARVLGTIGYEVVCALSSRIPRLYTTAP